MKKIITCMFTMLLLATALPVVDADRIERVHYLPSLVVIGISCSGDQHDWVPSTMPDTDDPVAWALSGEPECAPNDVRNTAQGTNDAGGVGAAAFTIQSMDHMAIVTTDDEVFGPHDSWLHVSAPPSASTGENEEAEGCGTQMVYFPSDMGDPWNRHPPLMWAFVDEVGVEDDLSRVCFATTGWIEANIGTLA